MGKLSDHRCSSSRSPERLDCTLMSTGPNSTLFSVGATTTPENLEGDTHLYAAPSFGLNVHDVSDHDLIVMRDALNEYLSDVRGL